MDLLSKIMECEEANIDEIMTGAIDESNATCEKIERIGFIQNGKAVSTLKGFIPLDTRIKYSSLGMEDYSMKSTDYMYEFARFLRKNNINKKGAIVRVLQTYINSYFGMSKGKTREEIFADNAWNSSTTDEEYFELLENNKIGDLRGTGAAMCTERSAVAQELLSLFGFESYYAIGCIDTGKKEEAHAFNIVKRKDDYALLDYSVQVTSFNKEGIVQGFYPFLGILSNEEFLDFVNKGKIKEFENYEYVSGKKVSTGTRRRYVVGKYEIEKNKTEEKSNENLY